MAMADGKKATDDPSRAFASPREVAESDLPREEKIRILRSWELDARRLLESAEENKGSLRPSTARGSACLERNYWDLSSV
jgi:hypothetical protein